MIITPSGCSTDTLEPDGLVAMSLAGDVKGAASPSSEWAMHAAIYLAFPAAQCVVHTHADACTALASLNVALPPFHYMVANFGGECSLRALCHVRHTGVGGARGEGA